MVSYLESCSKLLTMCERRVTKIPLLAKNLGDKFKWRRGINKLDHNNI